MERLKEVVARGSQKVPFYKKRFAEARVSANDVNSLEDLVRFPFTEKQDLRDNYPFGILAVPLDEIMQIHATSGTTGR